MGKSKKQTLAALPQAQVMLRTNFFSHSLSREEEVYLSEEAAHGNCCTCTYKPYNAIISGSSGNMAIANRAKGYHLYLFLPAGAPIGQLVHKRNRHEVYGEGGAHLGDVKRAGSGGFCCGGTVSFKFIESSSKVELQRGTLAPPPGCCSAGSGKALDPFNSQTMEKVGEVWMDRGTGCCGTGPATGYAVKYGPTATGDDRATSLFIVLTMLNQIELSDDQSTAC